MKTLINLGLTVFPLLECDAATYYTVVFGQLTTFGIFLAFYQFVASQSDDKYLGQKISAHFYDNRIAERLISSLCFVIPFVIEILCLPLKTLFSSLSFGIMVNLINYFWSFAVIVFLVLFAVLFWKCAVQIVHGKILFKRQIKRDVARKINKRLFDDFRIKARSIFRTDIACVRNLVLGAYDYVGEDQEDRRLFFELTEDVFNWYLERRDKKVKDIETKTEKHWINYTKLLREELDFINSYADVLGKTKAYDKNLLSFYFKIMEKTMNIASAKEFDKLDYNNPVVSWNNDKKAFNVRNCDDTIQKLITIMDDNEIKKMLLHMLYVVRRDDKSLMMQFCNRKIKEFLREKWYQVLQDECDIAAFNDTFGKVLGEEKYNNTYAWIIADNISSFEKIDDRRYVELLDARNSAFLFYYFILYYSAYAFIFDWKHMPVETLKALWERLEKRDTVNEYVKNRISSSNAAHRIDSASVDRIIEVIKADNTLSLLNKLKDEDGIDQFYVFAIKTAVIGQSVNHYAGTIDEDTVNYCINKLTYHSEIAGTPLVKDFVAYLQFEHFASMTTFPRSISNNNQLGAFVLTHFPVADPILSENEWLIYNRGFGEYLLTRSWEGINPELVHKCAYGAFERSNKDCDEYIVYISDEFKKYGFPLKQSTISLMKKRLSQMGV